MYTVGFLRTARTGRASGVFRLDGEILRVFPEVRAMARANRAFMQRAVRFLAGEAGVRQFIDIGTGIPSAGNVHEVAGQVAPGARVVYVDNDRCKLGCAHAWSAGTDARTLSACMR